MAVQYAGGTNVNTTFVNTSGTRREIVDGIVAALTSAGWSTVSGGGTGDVKMKTALTPQNNQLVVRLYDPGSGSCARLQLYTPDLGRSQSDNIYLVPTALKVWRVIANQFQFFAFVPGSVAPREFASCSAIFIPTFMSGVVNSAGFLHGQSKFDSDTSTTVAMFRTLTSSYLSSSNWQQNVAYIVNGSIWETINLTDGGAVGVAQLCVPFRGNFGAGLGPYRWADLSWSTYDPFIAWGTTGSHDEALMRGQMWDMVVIGEQNLAGDTTYSYDGRNFYNLTFQNGSSNHSCWVMVP